MKRICSLIIAAALGLAFASCGNNDLPNGVMTKDEMVDFLSEAYLLEGFYAIESNNQPERVSYEVKASYDALLKEHHITDADFKASMNYYSQHLDQYEEIHGEVISRLESMPSE
ncbi:MAG: DUF4296 domain-containing protein [Bacteroidales bacterium]|nr:DUF4296 domain-containing protein [Bacteroidales bacterium]